MSLAAIFSMEAKPNESQKGTTGTMLQPAKLAQKAMPNKDATTLTMG